MNAAIQPPAPGGPYTVKITVRESVELRMGWCVTQPR